MRPYWAAFKVTLQNTLRYRANVFFYLSLVLVPPLAMFFLWRTVLGETGSLSTYTLRDMVTYYLVTHFFGSLLPAAWTDIGRSIRTGEISRWLVCPASHFGLFLAQSLGVTAVLAGVSLAGWLVLVAVLRGYFLWPHPGDAILAVAFWIGGGLVYYLWGYLLNLLAFWTERAQGVWGLEDALVWFLGGAIIPLDVLPLREVWLALPFRFFGFLPAQVFLGRLGQGEILREFVGLILWLTVLGSVVFLAWRRGLRRYQAPGG